MARTAESAASVSGCTKLRTCVASLVIAPVAERHWPEALLPTNRIRLETRPRRHSATGAFLRRKTPICWPWWIVMAGMPCSISVMTREPP